MENMEKLITDFQSQNYSTFRQHHLFILTFMAGSCVSAIIELTLIITFWLWYICIRTRHQIRTPMEIFCLYNARVLTVTSVIKSICFALYQTTEHVHLILVITMYCLTAMSYATALFYAVSSLHIAAIYVIRYYHKTVYERSGTKYRYIIMILHILSSSYAYTGYFAFGTRHWWICYVDIPFHILLAVLYGVVFFAGAVKVAKDFQKTVFGWNYVKLRLAISHSLLGTYFLLILYAIMMFENPRCFVFYFVNFSPTLAILYIMFTLHMWSMSHEYESPLEYWSCKYSSETRTMVLNVTPHVHGINVQSDDGDVQFRPLEQLPSYTELQDANNARPPQYTETDPCPTPAATSSGNNQKLKLILIKTQERY